MTPEQHAEAVAHLEQLDTEIAVLNERIREEIEAARKHNHQRQAAALRRTELAGQALALRQAVAQYELAERAKQAQAAQVSSPPRDGESPILEEQ